MKKRRAKLLRQIAQRAMRDIEALPPSERADIYEGVAMITIGDDAAAAKLAAFSLRAAEEHQLKLWELLRS